MQYFYKFNTVAEYNSAKPGLPTNHVAMVNGEIYTNTISGSGTDFSDYYTKTEIDNKGFITTSAISDMETKTHAGQTYQAKGSYLTSSDIAGKANSSDVYTKTQIDNRISPLETVLSTSQVYRTGTDAPASTLGNDGDIYLQTS